MGWGEGLEGGGPFGEGRVHGVGKAVDGWTDSWRDRLAPQEGDGCPDGQKDRQKCGQTPTTDTLWTDGCPHRQMDTIPQQTPQWTDGCPQQTDGHNPHRRHSDGQTDTPVSHTDGQTPGQTQKEKERQNTLMDRQEDTRTDAQTNRRTPQQPRDTRKQQSEAADSSRKGCGRREGLGGRVWPCASPRPERVATGGCWHETPSWESVRHGVPGGPGALLAGALWGCSGGGAVLRILMRGSRGRAGEGAPVLGLLDGATGSWGGGWEIALILGGGGQHRGTGERRVNWGHREVTGRNWEAVVATRQPPSPATPAAARLGAESQPGWGPRV